MFKICLLAGAALLSGTALAQAETLTNVGISLGSMGNPFFVSLAAAAKQEAEKINPRVQVTALGYDYDIGKQFTEVDNFIAAGAQLILLNPGDPRAVEPAVRKAQKAGVRVVAVGDEVRGADVSVLTDNVQAGTLACQYLVDKIGGKGNVVIVNGPQVSSVIDRVKGCKAVFAKYPAVKLLSDDQDAKGSRDGGLAVMESLLTRYSHIDGVFAINDPTAIGADLAAKHLHRDEFIITSVDGAPDIVTALRGDTLIQASAAQEPQTMAIKGIQLGYDIMNGKPPPQTTILIPSSLVTRDNAASYKGW